MDDNSKMLIVNQLIQISNGLTLEEMLGAFNSSECAYIEDYIYSNNARTVKLGKHVNGFYCIMELETTNEFAYTYYDKEWNEIDGTAYIFGTLEQAVTQAIGALNY